MSHAAESAHDAPAILREVNPPALPRATLVENNRSFGWITDKICGIIEGKTPTWWWVCFVAAFLLSRTATSETVETVGDLGPYAASVLRDACSDVAGAVGTALGAVFIGRVGRKLARRVP